MRGASIRNDRLQCAAASARSGGAQAHMIAVRGTGESRSTTRRRSWPFATSGARASATCRRGRHRRRRTAPTIKGRWPRSARGCVPAKNFTDHEFQLRFGRGAMENMAKWKIEPVGSWEASDPVPTTRFVTRGAACRHAQHRLHRRGLRGRGNADRHRGSGGRPSRWRTSDAMGADPAEVGRLIALVLRDVQRGLLTRDDTWGLELTGQRRGKRVVHDGALEREGIGAIARQELARRKCRASAAARRTACSTSRASASICPRAARLGLGFRSASSCPGGPHLADVRLGGDPRARPRLRAGQVDPGSPDGKAEMQDVQDAG